MINDLSKDYFNCPHCGIKNVIYNKQSEHHENIRYEFNENSEAQWIIYDIAHYIIKCKRESCERLTYIKVKEQYSIPGSGWRDLEPREVDIQYPSGSSQLPDYVPENIRKFYREAVDALNFGLLSSASVMCRKIIYEICDKQKVGGKDYKEKIKNLGFDKRITDPLLNIKNIGDETVHAKSWDAETIQKAVDILAIIIDMIYTQEERIKDFSKHYSKINKDRGSKTQDIEKDE